MIMWRISGFVFAAQNCTVHLPRIRLPLMFCVMCPEIILWTLIPSDSYVLDLAGKHANSVGFPENFCLMEFLQIPYWVMRFVSSLETAT